MYIQLLQIICCLGAFVKSQPGRMAWGYFRALISVLFICASVLLL